MSNSKQLTMAEFEAWIPAEEFLRLYSGSAKEVLVTATDGRRLRFPGNVLRPFVTHDGVRGRFRIYFDRNHRFQRLERIAD